MPVNVMLQLCRITRASKLFQRNFFLPLLKPLSPKDALRRHIITGKNLLGSRIEHYMPVLEEFKERQQRRRYKVKGQVKKRQRKKSSMKYVTPFFDEDMEGHAELSRTIYRKSKGKGQCYTYFVPDKNCTLVVTHQMERAIRDKDIMDVVMAQRSEKIVVRLSNDVKVSLPLVAYDGHAPFYRGEGWTRKHVDETHHHGKETMSLAKLFEAKESGVEEWELEMMRLANKRKKKQKGEGTQDWKTMMAAAADNMDWDSFEEQAKTIVEEVKDPIDDEPIAMEVDDMEKTKNVNEKLQNAGPEVMAKLPLMPEIPECVRLMPDGEFTEIANVSGMSVQLESSGKECFVAGQMVKGDEGEIFMPGQTLPKEEGEGFEYTPGFTIVLDDEVTLLPGLVMGDSPEKPMFLPGESVISETGQLEFTKTEDDIDPNRVTPPPEPEDVPMVEEEDEETEEEEEEEEEIPVKKPERKPQKLEYHRPKRVVPESQGIKRREKTAKKTAAQLALEASKIEPTKTSVPLMEAKVYDMSTVNLEKDIIEQEKERVKKLNETKSTEERKINNKRREIILLARKMFTNLVNQKPAAYVPQEGVKKSAKLKEMEESIKQGNFFEVDHKKFLNKDLRKRSVNWKEPFEFQNVFDTVGINRYKLWKSVV